MKKSNLKTSGEPLAPEGDTSKKAREQYRKEIVESKRKVQDSLLKNDIVETQDEKDDSKFKELKKYLLSDITTQGFKGSSPMKSESSPRRSRSPRKKMIDKRAELTPTEQHVTSSGDSAVGKKSPSPRKKSSPTKNGIQESLVVENGANISPGKKLGLSKSSEKLAVPTPGSPRTGNRQRSPNLRYADDMVMFPLKSPKRQIFKKENVENKINSPGQQPKSTSNSSSECQTSQLYSLLTGTVVNAPSNSIGKAETTKSSSRKDKIDNKVEDKVDTESGNKEESKETHNEIEQSELIKENVVDHEKEKCKKVDLKTEALIGKNSGDNLTDETNVDNASKIIKKELSDQLPDTVQKSDVASSTKNDVDINCNSDEREKSDADKVPEKKDDPMPNVTKVIEQILIEAVQEETPQWAMYGDISEKYRIKKRKVVKLVQDKRSKSRGGLDDEIDDDSLLRDGDDSDEGGKRRMTRPISKSSMIRMAPALGLLVGHDEEGFMVLHKRKRQRSLNKIKEQGSLVESKSSARHAVKNKDGFEKEKNLQSLLPPKTVDTSIVSKTQPSLVTIPATSQAHIKLIGPTTMVGSMASLVAGNQSLVGTKATLLSGSQNLPCVIVPASSGLASKSNILIPGSQISLMPTTSGTVRVSPSASQSTNMVSMLQGSAVSIRATAPTSLSTAHPVRVASPATQIRTLIAPTGTSSPRPVQGTVFRLSPSGQLISSSGQPLLSTKVQPGIVGNIPCTQSTLLTNNNALGVTAGKGLLPNQKVLILKKSDINTSKAISIQVTCPGLTSGSIVSGQKSPIRSIAPSLQPKIGVTAPSETNEIISKTCVVSPSETGKTISKNEVTSSSEMGKTISKAGVTSPVETGKTVSKVGVTSLSETGQNISKVEVSSPSENGNTISKNGVTSPSEIGKTISKPTIKTTAPKRDNAELTILISKIQTNMSSMPELPDCLIDEIPAVITGSDVDRETDSEEEIDFTKFDYESDENDSDSNEDAESTSCTSSQNLEPMDQSADKKSILDIMEKSIETELQNVSEDLEDRKEEENVRRKDDCDSKMEIETSSTIEEIQNNISKNEDSESVTVQQIETEFENKQTGSVKEQKPTEIEKISANDPQQLSTDHDLEKQKSADGQDTTKDQSQTLQSKLKKAMESLSFVKSRLAAKSDASKHKQESKSESNQKEAVDKNQTVTFDDMKGVQNEEQNFHMTDISAKDFEPASGNISDLEDHCVRRNIFDVMLKDYKSPNKDGKTMGKSEQGDSSVKTSVENVDKEKSDGNLFDRSLKPKSESNEKSTHQPNKETTDDNIVELKHDDMPNGKESQLQNLVTPESNTCNVEDTPLMSELLENKCASSPVVLSDDDSNDSDIQIIKVQGAEESDNELEDEKEDEKITIADKLLAKLKKWEEENDKMKTPTKQPLKMKITSSPNKSIIVSSHGKKKKTNMRKVDGRFVPMNSTQREIKEPLPMAVLLKPEREVRNRLSAFHSEYLENFLIHQNSVEEDEEDEDDDEEDENEDDDEDDDNVDDNMSDMSMEENEPDFEEIDGILFMSFPTKNALNAHVHVERRTKLGTDENMLLGMARMRNMRRKQGYILSKYNKKVGNEFFKKQDNINQNLRGMHKTLAKYQRLYKQELYWLDHPQEGARSSSHKTNDITKIKGWKSKVGSVTEDVEQAKAEIENGGKLHWRTEARLAKNLKPDELKEIGLKKKRRKNIIYTQRKGMSKGDRSLRQDNMNNELEDDISRGGSPIQFVDDEVEMLEGHVDEMDESQMEREDIGEEDEAILFDPDDNVQDEELVRIQERELLKEDEQRKTRERNRILFKTSKLKKRMNYNLQDIQVIRKLGGHNIRRRKNAGGEYKGDYVVMDDKGSRPSTPDMSQDVEAENLNKKPGVKSKETMVMILTANMATAACTALSKQFVRKKPKATVIPTTPSRSPDPSQSVTCDKPGCRYGCICHLCMFTEQSPEADQRVVNCEKEYCRLGCICDSIEGRRDKGRLLKCAKPSCQPECLCDDPNSEKKSGEKDDKDYVPSSQKGNPRYAALPRRESTYRLAKNLDAVSRKAMLYYESSEMYADQKKARRRRSKDSLESAPQVYMDVDIDDFDTEQQFQIGPTSQMRLEAQLKKPIPLKPKSLMTTSVFKLPKKDMTDFSNIKSEISSQGSWNVDDLSDEYEGVEVLSDDESSTCARTTVYNVAHREKHCASGCTCGSKKSKHSHHEDGKFNIPKEILQSGKWHTQWICLRSKGHSVDDKFVESLRLLEVISNCDYEDMKAKILSSLTSYIALSMYPPLRTFIIGDFCVSILPKSNAPAVIPPEVKAKLPDSVYSIRVQVIRQPKVAKESPVINLTNDNVDDVVEIKAEKKKTRKEKKEKKEKSVKTELNQSELVKRLQNTPSTSSVVPGGISGLSHLQISCPLGPVKISSEQKTESPTVAVPTFPDKGTGQVVTVVDKANLPAGSVIFVPHAAKSMIGSTAAISVSQPINVVASSSNMTGTSVTSITNQPVLLVQETSNILKGSTVGIKAPIVGLPLPVVGNTSVMGVGQPILPKFPGYVLKGTSDSPQQQLNPGQLNDSQMKRKVSWQTVKMNPDVKRSKVDSSSPGVEGPRLVAQPMALPVDPLECLEPVSVLRCVRCNSILTTEDITSWVLSQDSISEKICVTCRGLKPNIVQPNLPTHLNPDGPIVIDDKDATKESSTKATKGPNTPCIDLTNGSELIRSVEDEANKIRNIVHDVDDSSIMSLECSKSNSSSQDTASEPVIDLSDENNDQSVVDISKNNSNIAVCDAGENQTAELKAEKIAKIDNDDKAVLAMADDSQGLKTLESKQSNDSIAGCDINGSSISKSVESKPEGIDKDSNAIADTEDEYDAAMLDTQDEDNIAHSLSDDEMQEAAPQKSNVIVIEDEEDGVSEDNCKDLEEVSGESRKDVEEEEDDIDVTGFSETDTINIIPDPDPLVPSPWHSSSCSLNNVMRRKRKAQMDVITNTMANQVEIREGFKSSEEFRKYRMEKNRERRSEEHQLYKAMASLVVPPNELQNMSAFFKNPAKTVILDRAIEYLQTEVPKTAQLVKRVKTFQQYQDKLQKRLEDLKEFHIQRGISKKKLDFQLDKIAVVCDRIYDHLPEIKQHIKSKKEGEGSNTPPQQSSPRQAKIVRVKTPPQGILSEKTKTATQHSSQRTAKKAKRTKSSPKSAEIYIDNPEDYEKDITGSTSQVAAGTSLSSLPGSYSSPRTINKQSKLKTGNIVQISSSVVSPPIIKIPMGVIKSSSVEVQGCTSFYGIPSKVTNLSSNPLGTPPIQAVGSTFVGVNQLIQSATSVRGQTPASITLPLSSEVISGASDIQVANLMNSKGIASSTVQASMINATSLTSASLPVMLEGSVTSLSSSLSQKIVSSSSTLETSVKNQSEAQSSRQQSPTDFRSIIGKIIKKNVIESQDDKDSYSQQSEADTQFDNNFPSFDENLLKDQILDDTTGEIINVVINDEENGNSNSSAKNSENSLPAKEKDDSPEDSNDENVKSKPMEVVEILSSPEKTSKNDNQTVSKTNEVEAKDEEPNIESLLDDIRALSQEDGSDSKTSPAKSSVSVEFSKQVEDEPSCTKTYKSKKLDQVDGDIFNLPDRKESGSHGNLSDADSNNSARTNVYMEDSDGNVSIAGDISDDPGDIISRSPKIVSVMSLSDVLGDNLEDNGDEMEISH